MKKFLLTTLGIAAILTLFTVAPMSARAEGETEEITENTEETNEVDYLFRIYYECREGDFKDDTFVPAFYREEDGIVKLPQPIKSGYIFDGWYSNKAYTRRIKTLNTSTSKYTGIMVNEENEPYIRLYAKWSPIVVEHPYISRLSNTIKGTINIYFNPGYAMKAAGYEIQCAYDPDFTKGVRTTEIHSIDGPAYLTKKMAKKTYHIRARAYIFDETDAKVYSDWCISKMIYVVNGSTELEPTPNAGTITSAMISGGSVVVTATFENRVATYDDAYHIVKLDPMSGAITADLGTCEKDTEVTGSFSVSGNLMARIALAAKTSETDYTLITKSTYIDNPEALASISIHPHPASKKGRQGTYSTSAGDKHTFHNVYLDQLVGTASSHDVAYSYGGNTYYFYYPTHGIDYNYLIRQANADGGTVSMQLMLRWNGNTNDLITPTGRSAGYNYYALNMEEAGARKKIEALFMFLAEYWSKSNLHVDNWILGNEVNTYLNTTGRWYWAGNISHDAFMENYANTFRILYYAVKSHNSAAQVFTCCDHTWNNRDRDWGTMGFITALNSSLRNMNPNIKWNLAYHAYTAVLTNADPWNDGAVRLYSVAHSTGASFVSPYNLEVMSNYVANNFPNTRIILSEVGFSSTGGTNPTLNGGRQSGPGVQAAATAYLYYKAHFTSNIDACIFHTGDEHEAGKNFAIEYNESWNVYKYMDTPQYANYTNGYLGYIGGAKSWESVIPGFSSSALANMPNR